MRDEFEDLIGAITGDHKTFETTAVAEHGAFVFCSWEVDETKSSRPSKSPRQAIAALEKKCA